jgi:hypothetical protein
VVEGSGRVPVGLDEDPAPVLEVGRVRDPEAARTQGPERPNTDTEQRRELVVRPFPS